MSQPKASYSRLYLGAELEVLAAPYHVGDAHQVVVHHIGEVVGGQAVPLQQHLVVQGLVLHGDVAEGHVVEGGGALVGDPLADHIGLAGLHTLSGLLRGQIPAGIVGAVKVTGVLLGCGLLAEAVVGGALFHQQVGVGLIQVPALRLDIGAHGAAYVGALVMGQAALRHGAVNYVRGALHQAALVGVLDPQDERAAGVPGDEPGVQGRPQIAHVHIAGGRGGEPGADLPLGDAGLHLLEKALIQCHANTSISGKLQKITTYIIP